MSIENATLSPIEVGVVLAERLWVEEVLAEGAGYTIFLADNRERDELVLGVVATSEAALEAALAGGAAGQILSRGRLGACHLAEVAVDERHIEAFGDRLFARPSTAFGPTLPAQEPGLPVLEVEALFAGRYRVVSLLGRGGMGEVYRAYDEVLQRTVALKIVCVDGTGTGTARDEFSRRLMKEARLVAGLNHPHIVEIHDAGESEGLPYLILELCEGGNLRHVVERGMASPEDRIRWMREIAEALAFAHARGIIHRDVKPENVVLTAAGSAKLVDFGIAKALAPDARVQVTQGIVGTPRYMAPEQLLGERVDARADQYAWALVIHELYTGAPLDRLTGASAERMVSLGVPPWAAPVLVRALAASREARFASMDEALEALRTANLLRSAKHGEFAEQTESESDEIETTSPVDTVPTASAPKPIPKARALVLPMVQIAAAMAGLGVALGAASTIAARGRPAAEPIPSATVPTHSVPRPEASAVHPEADALVAGGVQLWMDGASRLARQSFARAAERDPSSARSRVLFVAASEWMDSEAREHARVASSLRERLDGVDGALLDALQPLVAEPTDVALSTRRFDALALRYPEDRVARLARAFHYLRTRDSVGALRLATNAGGLPGNTPLWLSARAHLLAGNTDAARPQLQACIEASPGAADCLAWLATIDANEGRCAAAEGAARQLISTNPDDLIGYTLLARAVMGQTHSTAATRAVLQARWERGSTYMRSFLRSANEVVLDVYDGEFEKAYREIDAWDRVVATSSDAFERSYPRIWRIELNLELGRTKEAAEVAQSFALASHAWLPSDFYDTRIATARALYLTSQIGRTEFLQKRDVAIEMQQRKGGYYSSPGVRWLENYVETLRDPEDVAAAVEAEPSERLLIDPLEHDDGVDAALGRLYIRAGRIDEAIASLRRATATCQFGKPEYQVRAFLWLGEALEQKQDLPGACKAYAQVLERWGREPKSVTARAARVRSEAVCQRRDLQRRTP